MKKHEKVVLSAGESTKQQVVVEERWQIQSCRIVMTKKGETWLKEILLQNIKNHLATKIIQKNLAISSMMWPMLYHSFQSVLACQKKQDFYFFLHMPLDQNYPVKGILCWQSTPKHENEFNFPQASFCKIMIPTFWPLNFSFITNSAWFSYILYSLGKFFTAMLCGTNILSAS